MSSNLVPQKTCHVGGRCMLNLSRFERPPVAVVCKLGEGMPAQVLYSSLDRSSKLWGPSPKAFELQNSVKLIFTHDPVSNSSFTMGLC
ncbi:hypothetical protein TNCV_2409771 [Trichonephila clavipes]|nr:hypothetical protein TNCV_2409771 [Trichonephila clavipes]